ncbi:flagellar protein [Pseudoxanthomonas broegbernensis]|uniref:Flagellar hook-associated protein 2 n=1 Tax=Pseudoxanthomonas broegbernensis TaxID=83619 RepID=A0A7V8GL70_9GAMM|nr:flagellar filament capping protein FliD [Pseudoxanthomonas broegbernensis]KAF1685590.1 flagellar protein [Pseudoxanthomonas broegbernensis]MBB6065962.1 flagellar hook-associated protein 2 [Pseudoxanthomonas broegbernensis]
MATISFSGLGSGLDIGSLVDQLVAAERRPAERTITSSASKINSQLSALGTLKSSYSNLQAALLKLTASIGTPSHSTSVDSNAGFTASAGSSAAAGRYEVEVIALAQSHKLASGAFAEDAAVGSGTLHIGFGDKTLDVAIDADATLEQIARAVNRAAGGSGVTASVVNADDGQHLVFNATGPGSAGALTITTSGGDGGLAALVYDPDNGAATLQEVVAATDARLKVDGFERTATSNAVADLVPGLTLNLTKAKPGETFAVRVARDDGALKSNLQSLVGAFNAANTVLRSVSSYNAETKTASILTGDAMVRGMQQQLRSLVGSNVSELMALGVTIAKDGTLSLDSAKFDSAMAADPDSLNKLFGKEGTLSTRFDALLKGVLDSHSGSLTLRTNGLNKRIDGLSDQMDALNRRMEAVEARYLAQFTAMDTLVAQMQSTSSYLTQQLSALQAKTNK